MRMNAGFILGGQQPDIVNTLARADAARGARQNQEYQVDYRNALQTHGAGAMQGNQTAMNALAGYDPGMVQGLQTGRLNQQATQQRMAVLSAQEARAVEAHAASLSAAERQAEAQRIEQGVAMGLAAQTPEQWDQVVGQIAPELVGQFDNREMLANRYRSIADIMKAPPKASAAEQKIERLMAQGLDERTATMIADGVWVASRDPITGESIIVDKSTGNPVGQQASPAPAAPVAEAPQPEPTAQQPFSFGNQFDNADQAGGVGGAARGFANTAADTLGFSMPFPETDEAQRDFANFSESIVNTIASGYNRQPPSWLLKNISDLAPRPGITEGPEATQNKLRALGREIQTRRNSLSQQLQRRMRPAERTQIEGQLSALDAGMSQIQQALDGFGGVEIRQEVLDRLEAY